jgi:hypothetical protein
MQQPLFKLLPPTPAPSSKAIARPRGLSDDRGSGLSTLRSESAPSWRFELLQLMAAFRTAAAHGCQPAAAGRFFGLLTPTEQSSYTGRPGVLARLRHPLHESEEAATTRFSDLVPDLLTLAKAQ